MANPILSHSHPASLVNLPDEKAPSREGEVFRGVVDNQLVESRFHEIQFGDTIFFHADHVLAIHNVHRQELVSTMSLEDLKELASWLRIQPPDDGQ